MPPNDVSSEPSEFNRTAAKSVPVLPFRANCVAPPTTIRPSGWIAMEVA
jgi:hypothetical protein